MWLVALAASLAGCTSAPVPDREVAGDWRRVPGNDPYEVDGRTYYPLADGTGYRARGMASWYGGKFHGQATSSGETYDMDALTAAHRTLPLPTWAKVTNRRNGRTVVVRINDRGPFYADRLIDLSREAARRLEMLDAGTAPVEVVVLVTAAQRPARMGVPRIWFVQVGAFAEEARARATSRRLEQAGCGPVQVVQELRGLRRVRVGPVADFAAAQRTRDALVRQGFRRPRLVAE